MPRYAVIFPGQGAAVPAAGKPWLNHSAWERITHAESVVDHPLARLLLDADKDELATTRASQLAVLLTSLLAWDEFSAHVDEPPVAFSGHSLGQITALLAANAITTDDGMRLAFHRADMSQKSADGNPGCMAALAKSDPEQAEHICEGLDAWVANDNAPGQVVIAGTPDGMDKATARAKDHGVRRVMPLEVGHAFHTPLLADASEGLAPVLDSLSFKEPDAPIVANTDAQPHTDPSEWPEQLRRHLVEPVRWRESQLTLADLGVDTLVELGPGSVLAGLAKRTVPEVRVLGGGTPDEARSAAASVKGVQ